ncbi:unnamed protein product [Closterium sp. Yama58-4]|nr:unnamed protein product [Closterium sp. Yama58-4]
MARRSNSPLSAPLLALLLLSSFVHLSRAVTCDSDQNMWYCASGDECVSGDQLCDGTADCATRATRSSGSAADTRTAVRLRW